MTNLQKSFLNSIINSNDILESDANLLIPTCLLLASKIEETPINSKTIAGILQPQEYSSNSFHFLSKSSESQKLPDSLQIVECETYLMQQLDFQVTVFHPFDFLIKCLKDAKILTSSLHPSNQSLLSSWESTTTPSTTKSPNNNKNDSKTTPEVLGSAEESPNIAEQERLSPELEKRCLQVCVNFLNDSYFSDVCLHFPPHLIALAIVYMMSIFVTSQQQMSSMNNNNNGGEKTNDGGMWGTHREDDMLLMDDNNNSSLDGIDDDLSNIEVLEELRGCPQIEQRIRKWFSGLHVSMAKIGEIVDQILEIYHKSSNFNTRSNELALSYNKLKQRKL